MKIMVVSLLDRRMMLLKFVTNVAYETTDEKKGGRAACEVVVFDDANEMVPTTSRESAFEAIHKRDGRVFTTCNDTGHQ